MLKIQNQLKVVDSYMPTILFSVFMLFTCTRKHFVMTNVM